MADNNSGPLNRPSELRTAPSPFNTSTADIILRTSDHVDFHVYSQILIAASPFFEGLFEVPQPPADQQELQDGRPVVDLTEDSGTLETLLRICYPINKPARRTVQEIEPALRAAMKFEMELAITVLTADLKAAASSHPMQVWATACRLNLEDMARFASNVLTCTRMFRTGSLPLAFDELGDMEGISAGDYYRLSVFHLKERVVIEGYRFLSPQAGVRLQPEPTQTGQAPLGFLCDIPNPDVICCSSDGVQFLAHHAVLSAASSSLSEHIMSPYVTADACSTSSTPRTILHFEEGSTVVAALLRICYHDAVDDLLAADLPQLLRLLIALERHGLAEAHARFLSHWRELVKTAPLRAYCVAIHGGHYAHAKEAARQVLRTHLEDYYVDEMESTPALPYHRLWTYYRSCKCLATERLKKTLAVLSNATPSPAPAPATTFRNPTFKPFLAPPAPTRTSGRAGLGSLSQTAPEKTWIRHYVSQMLDDGPVFPHVPFAPLQDLFTEATGQADSSDRMWCDRCQPLAEDLIKADTHYKDLITAMDAIEFQI